MKIRKSNSGLLRFQTGRKASKFLCLLALISVFTLIPLYFPHSHKKLLFASIGYDRHHQLHDLVKPYAPQDSDSQSHSQPELAKDELHSSMSTPEKIQQITDSQNGTLENTTRSERDGGENRTTINPSEKCDLFTGDWVPNPEAPYYTNNTCFAIQEHQNCLKFGRPDTEFLKWKWKPDGCELPDFDPHKWMELMRGKSLMFVGDSIARNHIQSLICLLARVAKPVETAGPWDPNPQFLFPEFNFNVSIVSSPYLIRSERTDPDDVTRPFNLYLDEFDETWTAKIHSYDYIIISGGQWFLRQTYFYMNHTLVGCLYCPESDVDHLPMTFSYRWAFRTSLKALADFRGVAFVRTFATSHFEKAAWNEGGVCVRTKPFKRGEVTLEDQAREMYRIQLEEVGSAEVAGKLSVFDVTKAMMLRPDGHPSKYGRWRVENQTYPNDCAHWCLPGPVDVWNDMLLELVRREARVL